MLNAIIQASMRGRLLVILFVAGLIGGGLYAVQNLPIDAFPDVSSTQVKIIIKSPGLTPEEIGEILGIKKPAVFKRLTKMNEVLRKYLT